jgi:hypothetical protein
MRLPRFGIVASPVLSPPNAVFAFERPANRFTACRFLSVPFDADENTRLKALAACRSRRAWIRAEEPLRGRRLLFPQAVLGANTSIMP